MIRDHNGRAPISQQPHPGEGFSAASKVGPMLVSVLPLLRVENLRQISQNEGSYFGGKLLHLKRILIDGAIQS